MPARYLNASIMRAIDNETRATNALDYYSNIFEQIYHYKYYWDKAIGIQFYFQSDTTDSEDDLGNIFSYNCTLELIDSSSSDIIPELTTVVMLSMLVVITIPIVLYRKKNCPTNFFP